MTQLDNLDGSLKSVQPLVLRATVTGGDQSGFEVRTTRLLEAKDTSAGLVQILNKRDVEVGDVGAESEVHVGKGGGVAAVDHDRATCERPSSAVGNIRGLVDIGTWELLVGEAEVFM